MLKWEDIVYHPIQLVSTELIEMNVRRTENFANVKLGEIPFHLEVKSWGKVISKNEGYMYVDMKLEGNYENSKIFEIKIIYRGRCLDNNGVFTDEDFQKFLEIQSVRFLWPYLREIVSYAMRNMGLTFQPLPTIDVLNTLKRNFELGENKKDEPKD